MMPRFDGTGPMGRGPRTGRGLGRCSSVRSVNPGMDKDRQADSQNPGAFPGLFRGLGRGLGLGRGRGRGPGPGRAG